jgi:negative regulator of sigma E activity
VDATDWKWKVWLEMDPLILTIIVVLAAIWGFVGKVVYDHLQGNAAKQPAAQALSNVGATAPAVVQEPEMSPAEDTKDDEEEITRSKTGVPTWNIE